MPIGNAVFSENYSSEIINNLQTEEKFNHKPPDFKDSLVFRKSLADDSYIEHLGQNSSDHLYKKDCNILGTKVIHLKHVCWLHSATDFEFDTAHLTQLLKDVL